MAEMLGEESGGTNYGGSLRTKLQATYAYSETGNKNINILSITGGHPQREFLFSNDHTASATVRITGTESLVDISFIVKAGDVLDERLPEFDYVAITCAGPWRLILRSGRISK